MTHEAINHMKGTFPPLTSKRWGLEMIGRLHVTDALVRPQLETFMDTSQHLKWACGLPNAF